MHNITIYREMGKMNRVTTSNNNVAWVDMFKKFDRNEKGGLRRGGEY